MVNISALLHALPFSALEPCGIASISGLVSTPSAAGYGATDIRLYEPPAGQHVPFVEPVGAVTRMLQHGGEELGVAAAHAAALYTELRQRLPLLQRVRFFDSCDSDAAYEYIPLPVLTDFLKERVSVPANLLYFFECVSETLTHQPVFHEPKDRSNLLALTELPDISDAVAMIEFLPGAPWLDDSQEHFLHWREKIHPIAEQLEHSLGQLVYYFADLDDELDDDHGHRFLALHWCCEFKPESPFVRFLIEASGASDVDELKAALINIDNYTRATGQEGNLCNDWEPLNNQFMYVGDIVSKTVGMVFATLAAREMAATLLLQQINTDLRIIAPKEVATDEWLQMATKHCRSWSIEYIEHGQFDDQLAFLAQVDEFFVLANSMDNSKNSDLHISVSFEDLIWRAHLQCVPVNFYYLDGGNLINPERTLKESGVPARVAGYASSI